ncbi:MAG: DEAD/DEAH box helicase, partial [bacterium]|nr:DEAD/DEAH box helicase [bacterium]
MSLAERSLALLAATIEALGPAGEQRAGQEQMCAATAEAFAGGRHLAVAAGTGTGKSLAYLVPAVLSGQRVVVATATKALQDQLATKELPFLAGLAATRRLRPGAGTFSLELTKGRYNYLSR